MLSVLWFAAIQGIERNKDAADLAPQCFRVVIADTVNIDHIKRHYYICMAAINPTRIVPIGPKVDFAASHDRGRFERSCPCLIDVGIEGNN